MIFCFVRETKQLTLEELDRKWKLNLKPPTLLDLPGHMMPPFLLTSLLSPAEVFSVPTKKFIHYELTVWLPWFVKRYIFFQKIARPPPIIATAQEVGIVSDA